MSASKRPNCSPKRSADATANGARTRSAKSGYVGFVAVGVNAEAEYGDGLAGRRGGAARGLFTRFVEGIIQSQVVVGAHLRMVAR